MLSDSAKAEIDKMSREDLTLEVNKGASSRFQGVKFSYLKTRLSELQRQEGTKYSEAQISLAEEANAIAREASEQSRIANITSAKAYRMATFSTLVALLAVIVAALPQCQSAP